MPPRIYLDYNATTPLHPELAATLTQSLPLYGNPASPYLEGRCAHDAIEEARDSVIRFLDAPSAEVIFTSCASESNNHILKSVLWEKWGFIPHLIVSSIEHSSVLAACRFLETTEKATVTYLPVTPMGQVTPQDVQTAIRPETILIFIMTANNEVGTLQPLLEISKIAKAHNLLLGTDAVQAIGKIPLSFQELNLDFLTFSGHKCYAPKGIGGIVMRKGLTITPLIHGGSQERKNRAGTQNTLGIIALGRALPLLNKEEKIRSPLIRSLSKKLSHGILNTVSETELNGHPTEKIVSTLNISFHGLSAESLVIALDMAGISVSTGSACSTGSIEPSYVLEAMNLPKKTRESALRFSLGLFTTEQEINQVLKLLPPLVSKLRKASR